MAEGLKVMLAKEQDESRDIGVLTVQVWGGQVSLVFGPFVMLATRIYESRYFDQRTSRRSGVAVWVGMLPVLQKLLRLLQQKLQ